MELNADDRRIRRSIRAWFAAHTAAAVAILAPWPMALGWWIAFHDRHASGQTVRVGFALAGVGLVLTLVGGLTALIVGGVAMAMRPSAPGASAFSGSVALGVLSVLGALGWMYHTLSEALSHGLW